MNETELSKIWSQVQMIYQSQFGEDSCTQLIKKAMPVNINENYLTVIIGNNFMKKMLNEKAPQLEIILGELVSHPLKLHIRALENDVETEEEQEVPKPPVKTSAPTTTETTFQSNLDPKFRFENFVIGNNTRFTHAAALKVSEEPGTVYSPLFIYGKPGLGKTHLIQAIGNRLLEKNPYAKVFYTTTEAFVNDVVGAIRNHTANSLHEKYRKLDCLIIDDIQQLKGKEKTQEEFFNTFNALDSLHKQIIIASDRVPQEIETLQDRITSRLARGFLGDIQEPDFETRLAILQKKMEERKMTISKECLNMIASSITSDIRVLESVCNNLHLLYNMNEQITPELVMKIIEKHGSTVKHEGTTFDEVLQEVGNYYGVSSEELLGKKRSAKINDARQILMYLARTLTGLTFEDIGRELGGRDHTTVMHGYEKIYNSLNQNNPSLISGINFIKSKLT